MKVGKNMMPEPPGKPPVKGREPGWGTIIVVVAVLVVLGLLAAGILLFAWTMHKVYGPGNNKKGAPCPHPHPPWAHSGDGPAQ